MAWTVTTIPGEQFEVKDVNGERRMETAFRYIKKASVLELSIVPVPADPDARMITREQAQSGGSSESASLHTLESNQDKEFEMATVDELQLQVKTLEAQLGEKTATATAQTSRADALQSTVDTLNSSVDTLTTENTDLKTKVGGLETQVADFSAIQSQLDGVLSVERDAALELFKGSDPDAADTVVEEKKTMLAGLTTIPQIQEFSNAWKAVRDTKFPSGRQTSETGGGSGAGAGGSDEKAVQTRAPGNVRGY